MKQILSGIRPARCSRLDETMVGKSTSGIGATNSHGLCLGVVVLVSVLGSSVADPAAAGRETRSAQDFGQVAMLRKEVFDARRARFEAAAEHRAAMESARAATSPAFPNPPPLR